MIWKDIPNFEIRLANYKTFNWYFTRDNRFQYKAVCFLVLWKFGGSQQSKFLHIPYWFKKTTKKELEFMKEIDREIDEIWRSL